MREPPGATREDYVRHIDRLVEKHGEEWFKANWRQINALWDNYRMLKWLEARPEDFDRDGPIPDIRFHRVWPLDERRSLDGGADVE
jgi:hypothetical protein